MFEVKTEVNFSDGGMSPILERQQSGGGRVSSQKRSQGLICSGRAAKKVPPGMRKLVRHTTLAIISLDKEGSEDFNDEDTIWPAPNDAEKIVSFSDNQLYDDMAVDVESG